MTLSKLLQDIADALLRIDRSGQVFHQFRPGIGPFGEPQLVKLISNELASIPDYAGVRTKRCPDLLVPDKWAIEVKIVRPFGDNAREAENWSVNLLHPYEGNVSLIGDYHKLLVYKGPERRGLLVIGYEHNPARISLDPLVDSFECIATGPLQMKLSERVEERRAPLVHPVHQVVRLFGWEVLASCNDS